MKLDFDLHLPPELVTRFGGITVARSLLEGVTESLNRRQRKTWNSELTTLRHYGFKVWAVVLG